jgi:murein DD-endopeptidase MepM/ murein hydrolase activator NlpD
VANENAGFDAGVPARPGDPVLSRRELREREAQGATVTTPEHDVEAELERQLAVLRARALSVTPQAVSPQAVPAPVPAPEPAPSPQQPVPAQPPVSPETDPVLALFSEWTPLPAPEPANTSSIPRLSPLTRATLADVHEARAQEEPEPEVPVGSTARAQRPKRRGPFIAALAMGFVAAIALATSVPATALLSPEQMSLAAQQARAAAATGTDVGAAGQTVDGTGKVVAAGRDGVNVVGGRTQVSSLAGSNRTAGAYSTTKLKVTVPVSTTRLRWPFDSITVSSPFGYRESIWGSSNYHTGLDIAPTAGTPIRAIGDGIVTEVTGLGGMIGVSVTIDHNLNGMKFSSVYGHMQYGSPTVKPGDTISAGTVIGNVGSTGFATGPHLHLEIRTDEDGPQDPYPFLVQYAGSPPNFTKTF